MTAVFRVVAGKVAPEPQGTTDVKVLVTITVDCDRTGQFTSPGDTHTVAVYVTSVLVVVVNRSSLATIGAVVAAALAVTGVLLVTAHASPIVVYQIGIEVLGVGPQVRSPIASVAPAFAPSSIEYSSTTRSSQMLPSPVGASVTLVMNCATSAQTLAPSPVLKERSSAISANSWGVPNSKPTLAPTRRMAVSTVSALWTFTGRNSKLPPLLEGWRG